MLRFLRASAMTLATAVLTGLVPAGSAGAATVTEAVDGDFSGAFRSPTVIANGATTVEGVWAQGGDYDLLAFTGLASGAQKVTLTFAPLRPIGPFDWAFSAGGVVLYKAEPFKDSAWEGTLLASVGIQHWNRDADFTFTIALTDSFTGSLYLGLFGTYGTLKYTISAPGNAATTVAPAPVAAVPLPAGAPLLLAGLGVLALVGRRRAA